MLPPSEHASAVYYVWLHREWRRRGYVVGGGRRRGLRFLLWSFVAVFFLPFCCIFLFFVCIVSFFVWNVFVVELVGASFLQVPERRVEAPFLDRLLVKWSCFVVGKSMPEDLTVRRL